MLGTIFTGIITLFGVAIGGYIGYITSATVSDRKELRKASIDFHYAFLDALMSLDPKYFCKAESECNVCEILEQTFPQQMKAMLRFRLLLPTCKRKHFDKAWREYCHYDVDGEPEYPFLEQYFEKKWNGELTRELALKRIKKLIGFVELVHKSPLDIIKNRKLESKLFS